MKEHFPGLRNLLKEMHYGFISTLGTAHAKSVVERGKNGHHRSPHPNSLSKTIMAGIVTFKISLGGQATRNALVTVAALKLLGNSA